MFEFRILRELSDVSLLEKEEHSALLDARGAGVKVYNMRVVAASNRGLKHSEKTINGMRERMLGVIRGPMSLEAKKNISNSLKGRKSPTLGIPMSDSQKEKLRTARLGKKSGPMSEETKMKISQSRIGIAPWNKGNRIRRGVEGTHTV